MFGTRISSKRMYGSCPKAFKLLGSWEEKVCSDLNALSAAKSSKFIIMKGIITETELDFLVDTWAEVSVIPSSFAKQKGFMLSSQRKILTMLDGTVVSCDGIVTMPVKFQDTYIMEDFYVEDKASHGIIGLDILAHLNAKIDTQNHQVIIQNNVSESMKPETPEESKSKIATVCHIRLAKTTVVQPGHEQFIWEKYQQDKLSVEILLQSAKRSFCSELVC